MGGPRHAPAALPPLKTGYPSCRRLGVPQGRSERVRKVSPTIGIRSLDRPARSESLYRLRYCDRGTREKRYKITALDQPTLKSFFHQSCKRKNKQVANLSVLWIDRNCDRQHNVVDCSLRNRDCVRACVLVCEREAWNCCGAGCEDCCLVGSDVM
jgi:hypothetical protein